jgi:hypothetical protein
MTAIALNQLSLLTLPSVDILRHGWAAAEGMPDQSGCYAAIVSLSAKSGSIQMGDADRTNHSKALVWALGRANAESIVSAVSRGNRAAVTLYVGYSKNLGGRWAGSAHHKQNDLRAVVYLLGLFFDVRSLNLHYLLTHDDKQAKLIEGYLIDLWKPALNNKASIVRKTIDAAA